MAKQLIWYKLINGTIPAYVEDWWYYPNEDIYFWISKDDTEYTIPPETTIYTQEEWLAYVKTLWLTKQIEVTLTEAEVETEYNKFLEKLN